MLTTLRNPANGELVESIPQADAVEVGRAVTTAHARYASGVWRKAPVRERRDVLRGIADLIRRDHERLARLELGGNQHDLRRCRSRREIGAAEGSRLVMDGKRRDSASSPILYNEGLNFPSGDQ